MITVGERTFHLAMTVLVLASTLLDGAMRHVLPTWNPPQLGMVTFALGLVWVALAAGYRVRKLEERLRVLDDRIERSERKIDRLDREAAARR